MNRTESKCCHSKGFALVVALSLMILLTLLAVGLLGLSTISLRASGRSEAFAEAQANARLAMTIALGELRKEMGPDMRVSAEAALFDQNPQTESVDGLAQSRWLASYNSWGDWLNASYTPPDGGGSLTISDTYGMFNVNSTSVAAWQALFAGIRERQLVFRDGGGGLQEIDVPNGKRIAISRFNTELSDKEMSGPEYGGTLPDGSKGWSGVRFLDDDQLLKLAEECVKQVKQRGPFRIRAYGEALDPGGKNVLARAWCEVIVQRLPEYSDPTNQSSIPAREMNSQGVFSDNAALTAHNRRFGRKFHIESFRWLNGDEV